jgi:hypothetical protein
LQRKALYKPFEPHLQAIFGAPPRRHPGRSPKLSRAIVTLGPESDERASGLSARHPHHAQSFRMINGVPTRIVLEQHAAMAHAGGTVTVIEELREDEALRPADTQEQTHSRVRKSWQREAQTGM